MTERIRTGEGRGPLKLSSPRAGPDPMRIRALRGPLVAVLVLTVLAATAAVILVISRSRTPTSFLPENDSLWFPPDSGDASPPAPPAGNGSGRP